MDGPLLINMESGGWQHGGRSAATAYAVHYGASQPGLPREGLSQHMRAGCQPPAQGGGPYRQVIHSIADHMNAFRGLNTSSGFGVSHRPTVANTTMQRCHFNSIPARAESVGPGTAKPLSYRQPAVTMLRSEGWKGSGSHASRR